MTSLLISFVAPVLELVRGSSSSTSSPAIFSRYQSDKQLLQGAVKGSTGQASRAATNRGGQHARGNTAGTRGSTVQRGGGHIRGNTVQRGGGYTRGSTVQQRGGHTRGSTVQQRGGHTRGTIAKKFSLINNKS